MLFDWREDHPGRAPLWAICSGGLREDLWGGGDALTWPADRPRARTRLGVPPQTAGAGAQRPASPEVPRSAPLSPNHLALRPLQRSSPARAVWTTSTVEWTGTRSHTAQANSHDRRGPSSGSLHCFLAGIPIRLERRSRPRAQRQVISREGGGARNLWRGGALRACSAVRGGCQGASERVAGLPAASARPRLPRGPRAAAPRRSPTAKPARRERLRSAS
jgi:hypothetical protein